MSYLNHGKQYLCELIVPQANLKEKILGYIVKIEVLYLQQKCAYTIQVNKNIFYFTHAHRRPYDLFKNIIFIK